jgi:hypothetical protein
MDARAASKRSFDVKTSFRRFKEGDDVLLYIPSPPKGENSKFYTPWRGIYRVIERTSQLTYVVRKKGGRTRRAHVNRLKKFDPLNSMEDPKVHISLDDDEPDKMGNNMPPTEQVQDHPPQDPIQHQPSTTPTNTRDDENLEFTRVTRSKTRSLPAQINRYSASATGITEKWRHIPWVSEEMNIILNHEGSTVGQNFPV